MNYLDLVQRIIPYDYREACMGDLYELDHRRRESKRSTFSCSLLLMIQAFFLTYVGIRMRLDDFYYKLASKKQYLPALKAFIQAQKALEEILALLSGKIYFLQIERRHTYAVDGLQILLISFVIFVTLKLILLLPLLSITGHLLD